MFCNSRFNSPTENMLVRIQNTMVGAINKNIALSEYVIVVFDDDLITFLNYNNTGVARLLGDWLTWIVNEIESAVKQCFDQLPAKAKHQIPCIYGVLAPLHTNFGTR